MERDIILKRWNDSVAAYRDQPAVVFDGKAFTYGEIDAVSDRIAAHLQSVCGVTTEDIVGVMIDRSELMAIYPLAIMKCGAAYMPLDSHFPEERLAFMCEDAGVKLILADDGLVQKTMPSWDKGLFEKKTIATLPEAKAVLPDDFCESSLLVILYTSGSTGKPKGVMLEQAGLVNWCKGYIENTQMTSSDRSLAYANFGFDAHMLDLYPTFMAGACVYILDNETRLDLVAMNEFINKNAITITFFTTQIAYQMATMFDLPTVRTISTGGEKLPPIDVPEGLRFFNVYGPTECTISATMKLVKGFDDGKNLGHAQSGYEIAVIDAELKEVAPGVEGELLIMGIGVGRGYLNRPDVTAEKFITFNGKRAYRTGDAVIMQDDGTIEFVGRMDGQVKLRGLRIELGEVESAMLQHPAVAFAAAAVKEVAGAGHLYGYYQLKEGTEATADDIKETMSQTVTDFMIPEELLLLDTIPYTPNGKVDKRALPVPAVEVAADDDDIPARELNTIERTLADMLCSIVGIEKAGVSKPLKLYGLTSLLAMRFAVSIHKEFGVKFTGKELMAGCTLFDVEEKILETLLAKPSAEEAQKPSAEAKHEEKEQTSAPLTFAQQGVYIDCLRNPESIAYNLPYILHLPKEAAAEDVADAVKAIVEAHPALSIVFGENDGEACQMVSQQNVVVPVRSLSVDEANAYKAEFIKPFDLAAGPLYRFEVITTEQDVQLFMDMHHLVCDGGSYDMFIKELLARMMKQDVDAEACSYISFASAQHDDKARYGECKAFFAEQLKDFDIATEIPADKNDDSDKGEGIVVKSATDMAAISAYAKSLGVSPSAVFLAATFYVAARFTNNKQVYLGTISNGRSNVDVADTIGMFVNTLPLACKLEEQTVEQFVLQCADTFNSTIDHEDYPFAQIAADYGFQPNLMFEYQVGVLDKYMLNGNEATLESLDEGTAKFKTAVRIWDEGVTIEYNAAYYGNETMQCMADCISATASAIVAAQKGDLMKHVSMLDDKARQTLDGIRHTCLDPDAITFNLFHESVEYWAEQTPDATAIVACNETLTYSEFNEKANLLAHALINKGVVPGDRVCLLLPRKSWHLLAMFGVMKAGAAYIPCDPEYPSERINLITEDSHARYVITTEEKMADYGDRALNVEELFDAVSDDWKQNPTGIFDDKGCYLNAGAAQGDAVAVKGDESPLAYLIYTSGSTGRPKGVMLHHRGICNYLTPHVENRHIHAFVNECKAMMGITTVSFDLSLKELGATFYNGKTLVFANEDEIMSPILMAELYKRTGCDGFNGTPSRLKMFLELPEFQEVVKNIKVIILGGEKYPATLIPQLRSLSKARLFNTYGPTEITVSSNVGELTHEEKVTVGEPLLNYTECVVDADDNELPVGVVGELLISGIGVGRGYNDLPEKTAEAFIEYHGRRAYRSGDYARWLPNGKVEILGRKDHQIKLNGLRIELGEVETVLNKQPQVKEGVVMIKSVEGRDHLVAYYTVKEDVDVDTLKEQMGKSLTHYMVPTIFMQMEKMPISPNGKTDLKSLPEPVMAEREYVEPQNDIEKFFCDCFATILEREKVGATDHFFEIGGTSLIAMRVVMSAAKGGYRIVYKDVFDNPTPRKLAVKLGAAPVAGDKPKKAVVKTAAGIISNPDDPEASNYDYTKINAQLAKNDLQTLTTEPLRALGTCVVTGATGYLGIHIVHELILRDDVNAIYCMVRAGRNISAESRLRTQLFYYFGDTYSELFGKRIFVIEGDVTKPECLDSLIATFPSGKMDGVLFNCAANVKHFSAGTDIEDINIGGCQTCIDFCLKTGMRFIQTSTHSISGYSVGENVTPHRMTEKELYWGQNLDNQYIHSKFLAERNVLEAIVEKGLDGKIVRLGNLSARSTDGEFQINFSSNSFMGRLRALQTVGCAPFEISGSTVEFSPINEVAAAVVLLATTPSDCTVFNPVNSHRQLFDDILVVLNRLNVKIDLVEPEVFSEALSKAMDDPSQAAILQSLMAYQSNGAESIVENSDNYEYTTQVLLRLGFRWNFTTWDYMERFIVAIQGLGFFDDDYQR